MINRIQKSQGHFRLSRMMAPRSGPIVGPRSGPRRYQPKIPARSLGAYISLIVPPPLAIPILPKKPAIVLKVMSTGNVFANAVGICSKVKMVKHTRYRGFLPNVSDSGAKTKGPIPSMTTKPV